MNCVPLCFLLDEDQGCIRKRDQSHRRRPHQDRRRSHKNSLNTKQRMFLTRIKRMFGYFIVYKMCLFDSGDDDKKYCFVHVSHVKHLLQ